MLIVLAKMKEKEESGERKNWKEGDEEKERRILNQ